MPTDDTPRVDFTDAELAAYRERRYAAEQARRAAPRRDLVPCPPQWRDTVRAALANRDTATTR